MHIWNVYKIFKNGKRAKAPTALFEHESEDTDLVLKHFESTIKEKFSEKIRGWNFALVRGDASQERVNEEEDQFKNQKLVLGALVRESDIKSKRKIMGGLLYSKDTNWKWQWCALESATSQFIEALSPEHTSFEGAQEWMNKKIEALG